MFKSIATSRTEITRIGKFGLVGVLNTLIDFAIYNFGSSSLGLTLVEANLLSTSIAMIFSFLANRQLVFAKSNRKIHHEIALFYAVTAFGVYVLQSLVIYLLTTVWPTPLSVLASSLVAIGLHASSAFVVKNLAKAAATVVSLIWNYVMYKHVVFE